MLLSFVIPLGGEVLPDREANLKAVLRWISRQTIEDFELVFVEQVDEEPGQQLFWQDVLESLSNEEKYSRAISRLKYFRIQGGPPSIVWCFNVGAKQAQGEYLWLGDSDEIHPSNRAEKALTYMEEKNIGYVFPWQSKIFADGMIRDKLLQNDSLCEDYSWIQGSMIHGLQPNCHCGGTFLITRDLFLNVLGGYLENYINRNDSDQEFAFRVWRVTGEWNAFPEASIHLEHSRYRPWHPDQCNSAKTHPHETSKKLIAAGVGKLEHRTIIDLEHWEIPT